MGVFCCAAIILVSKYLPELKAPLLVDLDHQPRGNMMLKIAAVTGALAIGIVSGAYAQTTGPAGQQDMNKPGMTNSNSDAMKKSGTTGMSSGGGFGMTDKGGANGTPAMAPKTTTGPAGSASKSESPPK
jgi:hypothetical protein